jgi:hypothetical protein
MYEPLTEKRTEIIEQAIIAFPELKSAIPFQVATLLLEEERFIPANIMATLARLTEWEVPDVLLAQTRNYLVSLNSVKDLLQTLLSRLTSPECTQTPDVMVVRRWLEALSIHRETLPVLESQSEDEALL